MIVALMDLSIQQIMLMSVFAGYFLQQTKFCQDLILRHAAKNKESDEVHDE